MKMATDHCETSWAYLPFQPNPKGGLFMPTESTRIARFNFDKVAAKKGTLNVSVPSKLKDFSVINKSVIDRISKLTGHQGCLSGGIKVVIEEDFSDILRF
jgi:hypothetical protein